MGDSIFGILFSSIFVSNIILSRFLGMCSFLGVSKNFNNSLGMGAAVTFVMLLATMLSYALYHLILVPFDLTYLKTLVFILSIATLVQLVEMFMKKTMPALHKAMGIYLPLITTNCCVLGVTILAVQDFNQAVRDYGEKSANILKASCGTQAYGMTGNEKTAKDIENLFGEQKEAQESFSQQEGGGNSRTESLQKEKVLKAREVAGQSAGHFIGKIAGGKPPFFNVQMNMCKFEEKEIPPFSLPVKLASGNEKLEMDILEEIVQQNYVKIIEDVNQVLEPIARKKAEKDKLKKPNDSRNNKNMKL